MKLTALFVLTSLYSLALFAGTLSTGEPLSKWNKLSVTVCWLDDEAIKNTDYAYGTLQAINDLGESFTKASDKLKKDIQGAIEREYTATRTGIHFVGWKSCESTPAYDVQILIGEEAQGFDGKASVGRVANINNSYDLMDAHQKGYVYLSTRPRKNIRISQSVAIISTAIHEFGHLAGLRHEHMRRESNDCHPTQESPLVPTEFFSAYDPSSIMNYCFTDFIEKFGLNFYVKKSSQSESVTNSKLPILPYSKVKGYTDKTIFNSKLIANDLYEYKVNIGLSKGDIHGLKCLYLYGKIESKLKCHEYNRI